MRFVDLLVVLFPLWAVVGTVGALVLPDNLTPLSPAIIPLLGVVMFGMGLTLTAREFLEVARRPLLIASGAVLQFGIMPFAAWTVGHAMSLQPDLLVGLILVGACPGGTASNVICYLARGDVALSITFTTVSTFLAILLTPALTWLYVGESVPVPVISMLLSILEVVILPVLAGVAVNQFFGARLAFLRGMFPLISVAAIVVIIAIVVALNAGLTAVLAWPLVIAVMLHNSLGLAAGYSLPKLFGLDARISRTFAIEVGMQNSGLGVVLATQFFSAAAALPGAVFSVWHNLSGSFLAAYWARRPSHQLQGITHR